MFTSVFAVLHPTKKPARVQMMLEAIQAACQRAHVNFVTEEAAIFNTTLIVAIGGDGTMLQAMRTAVLHDATAVGINLGRVGFLTDINSSQFPSQVNFEDFFTNLLTGSNVNQFVEQRTMLWIIRGAKPNLAGNEVSISRTGSDSMIEYSIYVNRSAVGTHRANSILISTATGSTAYALSAGGALMLPALDAFQIVPVAPLTLTSRPIVVPGDSLITIEAWASGISVRADGNVIEETNQTFTRENPFSITLQAFERRCKVLHLDGWNFFDILSEKLGWIKE
jgi:NAD+ kinase